RARLEDDDLGSARADVRHDERAEVDARLQAAGHESGLEPGPDLDHPDLALLEIRREVARAGAERYRGWIREVLLLDQIAPEVHDLDNARVCVLRLAGHEPRVEPGIAAQEKLLEVDEARPA